MASSDCWSLPFSRSASLSRKVITACELAARCSIFIWMNSFTSEFTRV